MDLQAHANCRTMDKEDAARDPRYRLTEAVYPERYDIHLKPNLATDSFKFTGEVTIALVVKAEQKSLILNAAELVVDSAALKKSAAEHTELSATKIQIDAELERVELTFAEPVAPGSYTLHLKFSGQINDKLRGFYRSAQTLASGEKRYIALTQFEATDARRAFPCFDEPQFKAVFALTLTVKDDLTAISNTPVQQETKADGWKTVAFKETMKMSTYIVAFLVGHFDASRVVMVDGVPLRIYAPLGKGNLTEFALEIGASALAFFNRYYGISYPGEKMDMIAVPDFAFGAMENLGAVIYRENALLIDPAKASHAELERVADVVAHELAHMWFGNLTTMKWWNGIWLNEAFATFMQLVAVDNFRPQWRRWETFGVSRAAAFATDGLTATRKIEYPVIKPEEANGMFDVLTYEKGASVLRMLEQYVGADKFKDGVNGYLRKHKFGNTETHDLWLALAQSTEEPVQEIMDSWIFQEGYPLIDVSLTADKKGLQLSQKRFFYLNDANAKDSTCFQVPLKLRVSTATGITEKRHLLSDKKETILFDGPIDSVLVNAGGHGFYRVNYEAALLEKLEQAITASFKTEVEIKHGGSAEVSERASLTLSALERFNLVNDMFALTVNGTVPLNRFLNFIKLFQLESDKNVWSIIISALTYIDRVFPERESHMATLTTELLTPTFACLGYTAGAGESEQIKQLRGLALTALGTLGGKRDVQEKAAALYEAHKRGESVLDAEVLSAVVAILAHTGGEERYREFEDGFKNGGSPQEQERFMNALALFRDSALLQKTLEKTLTGAVRSQNAPYLVRNVMLNTSGRHVGWNFVKNNWKQIRETFPSLIITRLVEGVTGLVDEKLAAEVEVFFAEHPVQEGQKTVNQHLEKLKVALSLKRREPHQN
ncbi:MAG TPA: M1 family metallopeptidase [Candidatus Obscuribacter sp.]|nr:M1 family metallopeptidase [Candidatus Obscuribacter sp.]